MSEQIKRIKGRFKKPVKHHTIKTKVEDSPIAACLKELKASFEETEELRKKAIRDNSGPSPESPILP